MNTSNIASIVEDIQASEFKSAHASCLSALSEEPKNPSYRYYLGVCEVALGNNAKALEHFIAVQPHFTHDANYFYNVGLASQGILNNPQARKCYEIALRINKNHLKSLQNLIVVYLDLNLLAHALITAKQALDIAPSNADTHWNYALALFNAKKYKQAFASYEFGLVNQKRVTYGSFELPFYQGEDLKDKKIIVDVEQGLGDQIMFSSIIPDLIQTGADVTLISDDRLVKVLANSFNILVIGNSKKQRLIKPEKYDCQSYIGSLARFFRDSDESFQKSSAGYIKAPIEVIDKWKFTLNQISSKKKIGISWFGGITDRTIRLRSLDLSWLLPLLKMEQVEWINLQYKVSLSDIAAFNQQHNTNIISFDDASPMNELSDYCGLVQNLDLVITIDNSTAHFAGSMGVPCWVMLPVENNYRWQPDGDSSVWYDSIKLFRQTDSNDWQTVINTVHQNLKSIL